MKSFYTSIFISVLTLAVLAQGKDYLPETRDVILHHGDTSIKITVLVKNVEINTENDVTYYWLKRNKIHENKGGYTGNLLHGEYIVFNAHEKMICKGMFELGKKIGEWKFWYANGSIEHIEYWKDGRKDGDFRYYYSDGTLSYTREYQNDEEVPRDEKSEKTTNRKFFLFRKKNTSGEKPKKNSSSDKIKNKDTKPLSEDDAPGTEKTGLFRKKNKITSEEPSEEKTD